MIRAVALVWLARDADEAAVEAALRERAADPRVRASQLGWTLPGSVGGGRLHWDLALADAAALTALLRAVPGARFDAVAFRPRATHAPHPGLGPCVKRTLLVRVRPGADPVRVASFERALLDMPRHIGAIRNFALHRPDPALCPTRWTHVWEQEYADVAGLERDYLSHPHHWGVVDAFFDPECPQRVAESDLAHVYTTVERSVLAWDHEPRS